MKKYLFLLLCISVALTDCKKTSKDTPKTDDKKYDVTFSFSGFSEVVQSLHAPVPKVSAVGDTLKNYTNYLYYYVYNSSGALVNTSQQTSSLTTYGTISDKLVAGTYTVFFIASKEPLGFAGETGLTTVGIYPNGETWNDTFFKKMTLTIGTSNVTQSVRLDRIAGAIQVTLEDAIPASAAKIALVAQGEATVFSLNTGKASGSANKTRSFTLTSADIGVKNKSFLIHILNTSTTFSPLPLTLNIRGYNPQNGLLAEKTVTQVLCYQNKRTILTGTLFNSASASAGFTITVNPVWDADLPARTF